MTVHAAVIYILMTFVTAHLVAASQGDELYSAISSGDLITVRHLAPQLVSIDARYKYGLTPYQWARILGQAEILDFLASQGADSVSVSPPPGKVVDALLNDIARPDGPGAAVLIAQGGKVLFEKGYGLADIEHQTPIEPQTKFRIGSISKGFTAAAILKLQESGQISVKDRLTRFMPDFPRGEEITLEHLLTHTSGIYNYTDHPVFLSLMGRNLKRETLLTTIRKGPVNFAPGERMLYCNSGYFLLAQVIEQISGHSYTAVLRENLFLPLGLSDTGVHQGTEVVAEEAHGYRWSNNKVTKAPVWDESWVLGAGALYSTAENLNLWLDGLFGGMVLSDTSLKAMLTPGRTARDDPNRIKSEGYGYGWAISKLRGLPQILHTGGLDGFATSVMHFPTEKMNIILLTNARPAIPGMNVEVLCPLIAQVYLPDRMALRHVPTIDWTVSPSLYDRYVGRYDYGTGVGILTVTKEGDRLFAHLTGRLKLELFPVAETEFVFDWKVIDAHIKFVSDENGQVVEAIHRQGGDVIRAPRLP